MTENNAVVPEEEAVLSQQEEIQSQEEAQPQESPEETKTKLKRANRRLNEFQRFVIQAFVFILMVYVLFTYVIGVTAPPNNDMFPRIDATDLLVYYRLDKEPVAKDIVVFTKNNTRYVSRVVAIGGDTVEITDDGKIIVNNKYTYENYIYYETYPLTGYTQYPLTLAEGECFVLMDQRRGTEDSRYFGPVRYSEIDGIVITVMRRTNF